MEIPDLVTLYFPTLEELDQTHILDTRGRLDMYLRRGWPELDTRPDSPFGDWQLSPVAHLIAAAEVGLGRFMSDLNLANVASGVIWNCDFVTKFLKNFAITEDATLQASGTIRMVFDADVDYVLDRRTKFSFGGNSIFQLRLAETGAFLIRPVGGTLTAGTNSRNLSAISDTLFAVDLPVIGVMEAAIVAGDSAETDLLLPGTQSISALVDFDAGLPPESLPDLARKTCETFYAASPTSRGGTRMFLRKALPELTGVSPVLSGDEEMTRDTVNALGISDGRLDVYVKSGRFSAEEQLVRLPLIDGVFVAKLALTGIPAKIDSVVALSNPDLVLEGGEDYTVYSRSTNPATAPMAMASYSIHEQLWLAVPMPMTGSTPLIPTDIETGSGDESAVFRITYRTDPLLRTASETLNSRENAPVGVNVLVRGFIPLVLRSMTVTYKRVRGKVVRMDIAAAEILAYMKQLGAPSIFAAYRIFDAMVFAGAEDVVSITCTAGLQWSVAQKFLPASAPLLTDDYDAAVAAAESAQPITVSSSAGFSPSYSDPDGITFEAIGERNICFILDAENLHFTEQAL